LKKGLRIKIRLERRPDRPLRKLNGELLLRILEPEFMATMDDLRAWVAEEEARQATAEAQMSEAQLMELARVKRVEELRAELALLETAGRVPA
jgi:multidrug resistance efflux pump